jgi:biotin carboxyl carrier protein
MKMLRISLEGKTYDVGVEVLDDAMPASTGTSTALTSLLPVVQIPVAATQVGHPVVAADGYRIVTSPMAGRVFKSLVKEGDVVAYNQVLIVLDAMKMETPVVAPLAGTVRAVLVKEGDAVDDGSPLLQIEGQTQKSE